MRFEIHKKFRFEYNWSIEEYQQAQEEYLGHLRNINFKGRHSLVTYLGNSFFHDANLSRIIIDSNVKSISLMIFSVNDLEDINNFRKCHGIEPISYNKYTKNPVFYKCVFNKVSKLLFSETMDLTNGFDIIETELDFDADNKVFIVRISFSNEKEMEIHFKGSATVKIDNMSLVAELLCGLRKTIPYCSNCKSKMLSFNK